MHDESLTGIHMVSSCHCNCPWSHFNVACLFLSYQNERKWFWNIRNSTHSVSSFLIFGQNGHFLVVFEFYVGKTVCRGILDFLSEWRHNWNFHIISYLHTGVVFRIYILSCWSNFEIFTILRFWIWNQSVRPQWW